MTETRDSAGAASRDTLEETFQRWNELRDRSGVPERGGGGPMRILGFLGRTLRRLRDLGTSWDLQRDLFRALIDRKVSAEERFAGLEEREAVLRGTIDALREELRELPALRSRLEALRGELAELPALRDRFEALRDDLAELPALRDRLEILRVRQTLSEGTVADLGEELEARALGPVAGGAPRRRAAGPPMPLQPAALADILSVLEARVARAGGRAASAVEISLQDCRAEELLAAAQRHFGGRLWAAGAAMRIPNDLWIHVDFTADWNRPALLENAAARLAAGGAFVLLTARAAGEAPSHPGMGLEMDEELEAQGGVIVRALLWRAQVAPALKR